VPPDDTRTQLDDPARTLPPSAGPPTERLAVGFPEVPGYEVEAELGRGGMGVVYRGRQYGLNREVAIKMVLAGTHARPEELVRFLAEAETAARLQHHGIAQIFDQGRAGGLPYFAMEYVPGGSLADKLAGGPLTPAAAARLGRQLAEAVQHAHAAGVVHRDLKPANILLAADGGPKVTDFGLARRLDAGAGLTVTGAVSGTPSYMPPEQARGDLKAVGPAGDVYALGAVLFECLAGRPPFKGANPADTLRLVLGSPPPRLPGVPRDLATVVFKCLEKDPSRRYPSAAALADDLGRFLDGRPVTARRIGPVGQTWRWAKRNPAVAGLLAAVFGLLTAATAGAVLAAVRIDDARRAAAASGEQAGRDRNVAEAARADAKRQVVRLHLSTARQFLDADDPGAALLWSARAWREDAAGAEDEAAHRLRLGLSIAGLLPLTGLVVADGPLAEAVPAAGDRVVTRTAAGGVTVWAGATGTPLAHPAAATSLAVSADGTTLVTGCADGSARVWDVATGRLAQTVRHSDPVERVAVQPGGRLIAVAGRPAGVTLWNAADGRRHEPAPDVPGAYYVTFSPDGTSMATADAGGHARGWEVATGKPLTPPVPCTAQRPFERLWNHRPGPVFTPDGGRLLVADADGRKQGRLSVWNLADGAKVWGPVPGGGYHHTFSPDGKRLLAAGTRTTLHDTRTGAQLADLPTPRECQQAVFVGPDTVLTASTSGLLWKWRVDGPTAIRTPAVGQLTDSVRQLTPLPDGRSVLVAGWDGTARRYEVIPQQVQRYAFDCGRADLVLIADGKARRCFSPDGKTECRFQGDDPPRVGPRGANPLPLALATGGPVTAAEFSGDGRSVMTFDGAAVRIWDAVTGAARGPAVPFRPDNPGWEIWVCDDGRRLAVGTTAPWTATAYDVATGNRLVEVRFPDVPVETQETALVKTHVRISPDGRRLAATAGDYSGAVEVWDIDARARLSRFDPHRGWYAGMEFSADGSKLLFTSSDTTARLWDVATGTPAGPPLRHSNFVRSARLTADPGVAVATTSTGTAHVWNPLTGQLFGRWQAGATNVWLSRDGRRLVGRTPQGVVQTGLRPFALPQDQLDPVLDLLTGKRIDPASEGIEYLPAGTITKGPGKYQAAFRAWKGLPPD
jgi:WD40 repeat protein/predicted Ser/Thr protein kinase